MIWLVLAACGKGEDTAEIPDLSDGGGAEPAHAAGWAAAVTLEWCRENWQPEARLRTALSPRTEGGLIPDEQSAFWDVTVVSPEDPDHLCYANLKVDEAMWAGPLVIADDDDQYDGESPGLSGWTVNSTDIPGITGLDTFYFGLLDGDRVRAVLGEDALPGDFPGDAPAIQVAADLGDEALYVLDGRDGSVLLAP